MEQKRSLFKISINNLIKTIVIPIFIIFIISSVLITNYAIKDKINNNDTLLYQIADTNNRNLEIVSIATAKIASNVKIHGLLQEYSIEEKGYYKNKFSNDINELIGASLSYVTAYETVIINLKNGEKFTYGNLTYKDVSVKEFLEKEDFKYDKVNLVNDTIRNNEVILIIPIKNRATIVENIVVVVNKNLFIPKKEIFNNNNVRDIKMVKNYNPASKLNIKYEDGELFYTKYKNISEFNVSLIAEYKLNSIINIILKIILMVILGALVIAIAIVFYYRNHTEKILNPIMKTVKGIKHIRKTEEFDEIFEKSDVVEIDILNNYLNMLVGKINDLLKENQKINDEKLEIEISTLQSQITPHFIFNTLNSIRIQALLNEDKEVANNIKDFTTLIKNNFVKGNIHTFKDEILAIESYFNIMNFRYGKKINYTISIDLSLEDKKILKLLLQPIIENSIVHGLESSNYSGTIGIDVKSDDNKVIVKIKDDGCGISEKKIRDILNGKEDGIGVYNSNRRIKIYYGDDYGITINSKLNEYTETIIILPYIG